MQADRTKRAPQGGKLQRQIEALESGDTSTIGRTTQEIQRLDNIADLDAPLKRLDQCAEAALISAVTIAGLSASDAEEVLVQVWLLLENHQVASPEMAVKSLSDHLQIRLHFTLEKDADLVRSGLKDWAGKRGLRVH
jgi:hypothetical protein